MATIDLHLLFLEEAEVTFTDAIAAAHENKNGISLLRLARPSLCVRVLWGCTEMDKRPLAEHRNSSPLTTPLSQGPQGDHRERQAQRQRQGGDPAENPPHHPRQSAESLQRRLERGESEPRGVHHQDPVTLRATRCTPACACQPPSQYMLCFPLSVRPPTSCKERAASCSDVASSRTVLPRWWSALPCSPGVARAFARCLRNTPSRQTK